MSIKLSFEPVEIEGHANGNRFCHGRCHVEGGWIYEFSRWCNGQTTSYGVFVPDGTRTALTTDVGEGK